jgi:hypothetical protein
MIRHISSFMEPVDTLALSQISRWLAAVLAEGKDTSSDT